MYVYEEEMKIGNKIVCETNVINEWNENEPVNLIIWRMTRLDADSEEDGDNTTNMSNRRQTYFNSFAIY
ncbi:unnamed protein product [Acanthoscelides obtectus]|uniref:Uncharacterized protein n=1 Tax=Acanthoscelides obtectus TaxID=200917 RepID=A0A9P0LML9_ACAOB|nr:unnamed protein product [Acanthoscelides obtectus]CAK1655737.1 hypothetical protein AOBTE_LOCUS19288 [Acanthoscelides obtectus]